jgi:hypothetical protein
MDTTTIAAILAIFTGFFIAVLGGVAGIINKRLKRMEIKQDEKIAIEKAQSQYRIMIASSELSTKAIAQMFPDDKVLSNDEKAKLALKLQDNFVSVANGIDVTLPTVTAPNGMPLTPELVANEAHVFDLPSKATGG